MDSRQEMIREIQEKYDLDAPEVLSAMLKVPREEFIPKQYRDLAYRDGPVDIGHGQTISQPYTVAFMTDLLGLKGNERVLEIGTGSGYQAAVLSQLCAKVFTVERIKPLAQEASARLKKLGYQNIEVRTESGEVGWPEKAPFDAILVTAGMEEEPKILLDQLKNNGVLVAPVGAGPDKIMTKYTKRKGKIEKEGFGVFHFVPFVKS